MGWSTMKEMTPGQRMIELSCQIQNCYFFFDKTGDILGRRTPLLKEIIQPARVLAQLVLNHRTEPAMINVARALREWIDARPRRGRAWNIKDAAEQLANMVMTNNVPVLKNDLPF